MKYFRNHRFSYVALAIAAAAILMLPASAFAASSAPADAKEAGKVSKAAATKKDDGPTAAERRAADSKFEREKLDSSVFGDDEKAADEAAPGNEGSGSGSIVRAMFGLVVVIGAIFGLHYLLKRWGQSRMQAVSGATGIIDIVATQNIAPNRALHVVRVGNEMALIGATEHSISHLGTIDSNDMIFNAGGNGSSEFQSTLQGAMYGSQPGVPNGMGGAGASKQPLMQKIVENLQVMTAR